MSLESTMSSARTGAETGLLPGFAEPVVEAQRVFRAVLDGMSFPGRIVPLPLDLIAPEPLDATAAAVLLALADLDAPIWLDPAFDRPAVREFLAFHCGAPRVDRGRAAFALVTAEDGLDGLALGTAEYPERSATAILPLPGLGEERGEGVTLTLAGPGIRERNRLRVPGLSPALIAGLRRNEELFPQGIDLVLTAPRRLVCLPRTTRITVEG